MEIVVAPLLLAAILGRAVILLDGSVKLKKIKLIFLHELFNFSINPELTVEMLLTS